LSLRDFRLSVSDLLNDLARCYKYWIALTDCDGFRIDTLKHVSLEEARNFCGAIKEFANNLGKSNFFLVGEIAGGDFGQDRYLDVLDRKLNAALDIGEMRLALNGVAKGLIHPGVYFGAFDPGDARMGSHRNLGDRHVSILDDHDHVFGEKIRFSSEASSDHQVVAAWLFSSSPWAFLVSTTGQSRPWLALSRPSGSGCLAGKGQIVTCGRRCSAPSIREGGDVTVWPPRQQVSILISPVSLLLARQVATASINGTRPTSTLRRLPQRGRNILS
jgi:hypothetical protein